MCTAKQVECDLVSVGQFGPKERFLSMRTSSLRPYVASCCNTIVVLRRMLLVQIGHSNRFWGSWVLLCLVRDRYGGWSWVGSCAYID